MTTSSQVMAWMVSRVLEARTVRPKPPPPPRLPAEGTIESVVLRALSEGGPMSCVVMARRLRVSSPQDYERLRNAIYRLADRGLVERVGSEGRAMWTRAVWGARKHQGK